MEMEHLTGMEVVMEKDIKGKTELEF